MAMESKSNSEAPRAGSRQALRGIAFLVGAVILGIVAQRLQLTARIPAFLEQLRQAGPWGWVIFIGAYVAACVFLVPGSVLTLGAGAVFGVAQGFGLVSLASTLGASASFLIGRFLARDWVAARASANPKFAAIDAAVGAEGWRMVGLLRLSPVFPFNLLNYALGLTRVRFRDYAVASWIGMMPGTLLYVWIGAAAGDVVGAAAGRRTRQPIEWVLYGAGLLATVWVTVRITRVARAALASRLESSPASNPKAR